MSSKVSEFRQEDCLKTSDYYIIKDNIKIVIIPS